MISPKTVAENIRYWRELRNYKQEFVADQAGISRRWYVQLENGQVNFKVKHVLSIAEVLSIEPEILFKAHHQKNDQNQGKSLESLETQIKQAIRSVLEKLLVFILLLIII